ncbi:peroxisomal biogenesis factor 19 isoform X1 [Apis mellifera]|uniref:Peroxin-19 n=1 Tax=Apis mellifera TaxID=7460 RepID=A0A7M7GIF9_APIME|nr:peroxisomal biogenesis factor 19 isoform X1 [Apis mellifera]|eukprot:XP_006557347.1 peroxisomal biogenesis factor 19 isoform X1 [Apis mellifera]
MADEKSTPQTEDKELNDLLDSALKDFNKEQKSEKEDICKVNILESMPDKNISDISEDAWTTDFIKQAAEQFEENLQNFIQNGPDNELGASFQKMAQTVASVINDEDSFDKNTVNTDFKSAIAQALNDLSATSENLQSEAVLSDMIGQVSLEDGPGAILPFMQGMLQHLLSKEILYPSLKELIEKYSEWLEEKKTTVSSNDLQRFTKQLNLMQQVCIELDKEKDDDTEEIKRKRFETIISLMQEVQACGQLPEELIGEQTVPFQIDTEGDSVIPALLRSMESPQNCCLM